MTQSQISFNPDGSMRTWEYCPIVARTELVRLVLDLMCLSVWVKLMLFMITLEMLIIQSLFLF
jgi:hypothetical protein